MVSLRGEYLEVLPAIMTYCRVFPVQYDLRNVISWVHQMVVSPFVPVDGHSAVLVHASYRTNESERLVTTLTLSLTLSLYTSACNPPFLLQHEAL